MPWGLFMLRRVGRFLPLSLGLILAAAMAGGLLSACGKAPDVGKQTQSEKSSQPEQEAPREVRPEVPRDGKPTDGSVATSDGDDGHSSGKERPKKAKPSPSPTTPPPPPPAAETPGAGESGEKDKTAAVPEEPPSPPKNGAPAAGSAPATQPAPAPPPQPSAAPPDGTGRAVGGAPAAPAADKAFDVVPVFYGTDREIEPNPNRLQFGTERGHKLQLGRAMVTVPLAHKVPHIERPYAFEIPYFKVKVYEEKEDPAKHFTMQEIKALTREEMLAFIKERLSKSVDFKDHAFVFVHGFNTSFDYALYRTAQIVYDLKFDGAPFVYSWPSGGKVASYTYDKGSAEQAEPHLAEFLNLVVKESGAKSISLIAHSMGNELLLRVIERMRPQAPEGVVISQVILAAPDVDRDKFQNIAREITDFAQGVTLYAASNDRALGYSARFWGGVPRAGDVPKGGPLVVPGVDTIDVTSVSTDSLGLNHSGYAENKALLNDIKLLIQTGERPPDKRIPILEKVTTDAGGTYWRYPPTH